MEIKISISKKALPLGVMLLYGAPEMIRTPDLLVRSQTLYPAELPAQFGRISRPQSIITKPFDFCNRKFF